MASSQVHKPEGHYFKVLESHKKRLGDYEQIHFRKSVADMPALLRTNRTSQKPQTYVPYEDISLAPRRASKPELVPFDKNTAATYLRQTESQWLSPNLSRQEAAKLLFNKPIGTFVVRNSQKARYALSLRVPVDDPAVNHFLIQTNQQNFLTIQGSNLPFLSIYDLLAYFCFNKSGGMPCCLKPPINQTQGESSDSSESDPDEPQPYSVPSPTLLPRSMPPKVPPKSFMAPPTHEEIFINEKKQASFLNSVQAKLQEKNNKNVFQLSPPLSHTGRCRSAGGSPIPRKKKIPPPKPPRTDIPLDYAPVGDISHRETVELYKSARRVSGLVDMDISTLYLRTKNPTSPQNDSSGAKNLWKNDRFPLPGGPVPVPGVISHRSDSMGSVLGKERPLPPAKSDGALNAGSSSPKVMSLIQMFEAKSPEHSPVLRRTPPTKPKKTPPSPRRYGDNAPSRPPKPQPPPVPPRPLQSAGENNPVLPPRTPAPLVPPKPPGSRPPRTGSVNRWSMIEPRPEPVMEMKPTDEISSRVALKMWEEPADNVPRGRHSQHIYEQIESLGVEQQVNGLSTPESSHSPREGRGSPSNAPAVNSTSSQEDSAEGSSSSAKTSGSKWKPKPLPGWAKKLKFTRKPRKRIRKFIVTLAADPNQEFGSKINEFIADIKARSTEPHQTLLSETRAFLTQMHEFLIVEYKSGLINCGMESCDNFGHVVETTLQQLILGPLYEYICLRIVEFYTQNGFFYQVQKSIHLGKLKKPEEMGIRRNLVVPSDKAMAELSEVFSRMTQTPCAISKLEYLLEAVRLTYENVRDVKQPKKPMNDLGADDFLPLFVWVLVNCGFFRAEIEAEYMWGLAPPSLFNGEGGYYLTTLTSAVNVLKELSHQSSPAQLPIHTHVQLPTMNEMQTELKVYCEDEQTGQYSTAYYLPIVPTMTAAEICETIASRRLIPNPEKYALFMVINGKSIQIDDHRRPQEIKLQWTLERNIGNSTSTGSAYQPSSRFMAYKLRAPV